MAFSAALIEAASDLMVVRLIRAAMAAADGGGATGCAGTPRIEPRRVEHPTPRIEPRRVEHPTPRFEPRPVEHPRARIIPDPPIHIEPEHTSHCKSPLLPPWAIPVWKMPIERRPVIKVVIQRPDIKNKGSLIDTFI